MAGEDEDRTRVKKSPYIRIYCGFYLDSKMQEVSANAELLYLRALGWSKAENLDGAVPMSALPALCVKFNEPPEALCKELIAVGLWTPDNPTGVERPKWGAYQWTTARTEKRRANNRDRQDRRRHPERYEETNGSVPKEDTA